MSWNVIKFITSLSFLECNSIPVYDKTLPAVVTKNVSREGKLITGSSLNFSCQPNYGLINSISSCGLDGRWTPEITCVRGMYICTWKNKLKTTHFFFSQDCGNPDEIDNGSFLVNEESDEYPKGEEELYSSKYPHQVTYSCNPFHSTVPGSEMVLKCSNTSFTFEPELPVCLPGDQVVYKCLSSWFVLNFIKSFNRFFKVLMFQFILKPQSVQPRQPTIIPRLIFSWALTVSTYRRTE